MSLDSMNLIKMLICHLVSKDFKIFKKMTNKANNNQYKPHQQNKLKLLNQLNQS